MREALAPVRGPDGTSGARVRHGYRNGRKTRTLTGPKEWASTVVRRYQRRLREVKPRWR